MDLAPIPRAHRAPTLTEKKYLLFLSARTARPKSCDRPGAKTLKAMEAEGWIAFRPMRFDPHHCYITPHGEECLNIEEDKDCKARGSVEWRVMASMPEGVRVLEAALERIARADFDCTARQAWMAMQDCARVALARAENGA